MVQIGVTVLCDQITFSCNFFRHLSKHSFTQCIYLWVSPRLLGSNKPIGCTIHGKKQA